MNKDTNRHNGINDITDVIKGLTGTVTDMSRDAIDAIDDTPVGTGIYAVANGIKDAYGTAVERSQRLASKYGYANIDVWNLGDTEREHIGKVVMRYADSLEAHDELADDLRQAASGLLSYGTDIGMLDDVCIASLCDVKSHQETKARITHRYDDLRYRLSHDWDRIGRLVMSEYVAPAAHKHDDSDDTGNDAAAGGTIMANVADAIAKGANDAYLAHDKASNGVNWIDLNDLSSFELMRLSYMLDDFARGNIGHPDEYASRYGTLVRHDGGWSDEPLPIDVWDNRAIREEFDCEHGTPRLKPDGNLGNDYDATRAATVGDAGEDFVAWLTDINHASDVFKGWAKWMELKEGRDDNDSVRTRLTDEDVAPLHDEFLRCWHWIGMRLEDLWW